jgi:rhodanese-related sulfurtransferase/DNA-binding transcriptional ArsR family regulator
MPGNGARQAIFGCLAEVAQALGHAHRLELLELMAQGRCSVEKLAARSRLSFANTSRHLQILRRAHLVEAERSGKNVLYRLAGDAEVLALMHALSRTGERNAAEIERALNDYFRVRDAVEPVSREELAAWLEAGDVTVLDVRPEDEFALGHLPRAINIPVCELGHRADELSADRVVVAYCRGPYCIFSFEAVAALRERNYSARRLAGGYPGWKTSGLPVEPAD